VQYCWMADSEPASIEDFRSALAERGTDYLLVNQPDSNSAHIRFLGIFKGSPVIWDATVRALAYRQVGKARDNAVPRRQYIEIAPEGYPLRRITVGLNVAAIDPPALQKTIIMIRKYKRLHSGRHEFGAAANPG
jgi:hypothetical protein